MGHLLSKSTAVYLIFNAPRGFAQRHKNVVDTDVIVLHPVIRCTKDIKLAIPYLSM